MNPNEIGYSILQFDKNDNLRVVHSGIVDNSKLNEISKGYSSTSKRRVFENNKRKHEIYQISNF
jgi:hypothetical protein